MRRTIAKWATGLGLVAIAVGSVGGSCDGVPLEPVPWVAPFAVHTGGGWRTAFLGNVIVTMRDNPPFSGLANLEPQGVMIGLDRQPGDPPRPFAHNIDRNAGGFAFLRTAFRIVVDEGVDGGIPQDALNPLGLLGVAPAIWDASATAPPDPSQLNQVGLTNVRWHSSGIQLRVGTDVPVHLERFRYFGEIYKGQWAWENVPEASTRLRLHPSTRIVPIAAVRLIETNSQGQSVLPGVSREDIQMWFDGRAVETRAFASSSGGSSEMRVVDRDPRNHWSNREMEETGLATNGRLDPDLVQEPDEVWSLCGQRYGMNIQFQTQTIADLDISDFQAPCNHASQTNALSFQQCIQRWREGASIPGNNIAVFVARVFAGQMAAPAQAAEGGLVIGTNNLADASQGPNLLAHELGHVLGYGNNVFLDSFWTMGPPNLMGLGGSKELTREQCAIAYAAAAR